MSLHVRLLHTTPEKFESAQITGHFDLRLRKTRSGKSRVVGLKKFCFGPHESAKPTFSNSSGLSGVFDKLRFRDISVHGRPNRGNKAALRLFVSFVFLVKCLWMMSGKLFSQLIQKLRSRWLRNTWGERSILQLTSWNLGPKLRQPF